MTAFVQNRTTTRSFFLTVTALVVSFSAATCLAADASPAHCSIAQYEFLSAFHELGNTPKDNRLKQSLMESNKLLSECIKTLSAKLTPDIANALNASQTGMQSDLNYNIKTLEKTGGTERQELASMVDHALETTEILDSQIDLKNAPVGALRKQAVLMAYLKNRYLERVYSAAGGIMRANSAELSIEDLVLDFSKKLEVLRNDKKLIADKELYKKLNTAYVRFNFLQKAIMDYNKTAVPFVVNHHSAFIIKTLMEISNELEQKSAKAA